MSAFWIDNVSGKQVGINSKYIDNTKKNACKFQQEVTHTKKGVRESEKGD